MIHFRCLLDNQEICQLGKWTWESGDQGWGNKLGHHYMERIWSSRERL